MDRTGRGQPFALQRSRDTNRWDPFDNARAWPPLAPGPVAMLEPPQRSRAAQSQGFPPAQGSPPAMTAARAPSQDPPVSLNFDRDITALIAPASDARHGPSGAAFETTVGDRCLKIYAAPDRWLETPEVFACFCGSLSDPSGATRGLAALAVLAGALRAGP